MTSLPHRHRKRLSTVIWGYNDLHHGIIIQIAHLWKQKKRWAGIAILVSRRDLTLLTYQEKLICNLALIVAKALSLVAQQGW